MDRPTVAGTKLSVAQFRLLQRISDVGLTQTALPPGRRDRVAALRTIRALILRGLVVETQSESGEVRFELTDAGRRLTGPVDAR
jgi:hypothetical protein